MALIFGRFDKADEQVREAVLDLAHLRNPKEDFGKDQIASFARSARFLFEYALDREPEVTIRDLGKCILDLGREAQRSGHLGPHCRAATAQWRFKVFFHPRRQGGGTPSDEEGFMTLDEMASLFSGLKQPLTGLLRPQR